MPKTRTDAVATVTAAFLPVEEASRFTAIEASRCVTTMLEQQARVRAGAIGAAELQLVAEGSYLATQAHLRFAQAHTGLRALPDLLGVPHAAGPMECEPNEGQAFTFFTRAILRAEEPA